MTPLAAILERTEAAAYADLFRSAPSHLGLEVDESSAGVTLLAPAFDVLILNRTIGLGVESPPTRADVTRIVRRHRDAGTRQCGVQLSPDARPAELAGWIGEEGLVARDAWTKVHRGREPVPSAPTDLRVGPIGQPEAEIFGVLACQGFGMPSVLAPMLSASVGRAGWHHYMAWDDDQPAAVAAMYVQDNVGWLGIAATLPPFRGRGGQSALMATRIRDGIRLGCQMFVTETGQEHPDRPNPSFQNMMNAGFVVAYHRANYMLPAER